MSTQDLRPIEHETLGDHAYARLRHSILTGRFEPGEKLTIRGLSKQLNISPTPIRESLRRLAAEHAVEIAPNRFVRIPIMKAKELRELRDIRTALEGLATERAVARVDDALIAELKAVLAAGPSATRDRLMGKMLREARDVDVWHFTTPTEVALNMERLQRRIGRRYAFWAFLINGWRSDGLLHV